MFSLEKIGFGITENKKYGLVVSSRVIALKLGKDHSNVIKELERLESATIEEKLDPTSLLIPSTYKIDGQLREYKEYLLTRRGFLAYMFNIQGYLNFKLSYIDEFDRMKELIEQRSSQEWLQSRSNGKLIRRQTTDAIQQLIELANLQGASTTKFMYSNYTKLVKKYADIDDFNKPRDQYTAHELTNIAMFEDVVSKEILLGIQGGMHYSAIYEKAKEKCILLDSLINKNKELLELKNND